MSELHGHISDSLTLTLYMSVVPSTPSILTLILTCGLCVCVNAHEFVCVYVHMLKHVLVCVLCVSVEMCTVYMSVCQSMTEY